MESRELARLCYELADNQKGEDIVVLDMRGLSDVTDYFVIVSGSSDPHLRAILREIEEKLRDEYSIRPNAVEGAAPATWVVLDYLDVVVHVMRREVRQTYDLESLWGDAPRAEPTRASVHKSHSE